MNKLTDWKAGDVQPVETAFHPEERKKQEPYGNRKLAYTAERRAFSKFKVCILGRLHS